MNYSDYSIYKPGLFQNVPFSFKNSPQSLPVSTIIRLITPVFWLILQSPN